MLPIPLRWLTAIMLPVVLTAAAPQVWFCPLDSLYRPWIGYSGSPQYMSLFNPSAAWPQAAAHTNVFKVYSTWIGPASDADLQAQFADLNRRGIVLAMEAGVMTASSQCGTGVEGQDGENLLNFALRIKQHGGVLRYVAMDEPIYYWTLYSGTNGCRFTVDQMAAKAAANIRALLAQFPDVIIGDIEPFPVPSPNWLPQYQAGIEAFQRALGFPLAFFDADVDWSSPTYLADLASVRKMVASEGVPFGIIYNGNGSDTSDAQWIQSATQHMVAAELNLGSPDLVIFQSWNPYPKKLLPETDPDAFTWLIDTYFRSRTTLASSISGSMLQGTLTVTDTGRPIANAPINVTASPTVGPGVPTVYTLTGTIPSGTQKIVFGARVNRECNCEGTADFLVSSFALDAGAQGTIVRDFSNKLNGWSVADTGSPPPISQIEGMSLHIVAQPGQSVLLNCAQIPFTSPVPYTFRVNAQVAPETSGSGYFTLIFLGASGGEISRIRIPLAAATVSLGSTGTDAFGRYTLPLPAEVGSSFQVQSSYAGSSDNWPAQSTATWTSGPLPAASVKAVSGDGQSGPPGLPLPNPLVVAVSDNLGNPVAGTTLDFAATNASVAPASAQTDAMGHASVQVTLGATTGPATVTATAAGLAPVIYNFTVTPPLPAFTAGSVDNAASFAPGSIAPGEIGTIFGANLTNANGLNFSSGLPLPTQLVNVSVLVNGSAAPIFAVDNVNGQQQINFQVPWELAGQTSATLQVVNNSLASSPVNVPLLAAQPGIFAYNAAGGSFGAILHANYQLADSGHPTVAGETVLIYCTGLGTVSSTPADGAAGSGETTKTTPVVTIGGVTATVSFSGLAPGFVGLYQVNAQVPPGLAAGNQPVVIKMLGAASNTVLLPVN